MSFFAGAATRAEDIRMLEHGAPTVGHPAGCSCYSCNQRRSSKVLLNEYSPRCDATTLVTSDRPPTEVTCGRGARHAGLHIGEIPDNSQVAIWDEHLTRCFIAKR
jgi:hypothetical protein